jgi:hypothetical protein
VFSQNVVPGGDGEQNMAGSHTSDHAANAHAEMTSAARKRSWISFVVYASACLLAWVHPAISLGMIIGMSLLYIVPDAFGKKFL